LHWVIYRDKNCCIHISGFVVLLRAHAFVDSWTSRLQSLAEQPSTGLLKTLVYVAVNSNRTNVNTQI